MATELRCKGTRTDGKRCRSVFVSKETNLCPAHAPGGTERMSEMGKVGGARSTMRKGRIRDLPPLNSSKDAQVWLEKIGRAVLDGSLDAREANVGRQIVADWRKQQQEDQNAQKMDDLEKSMKAFRREIGKGDKDAA